jgi:hypothetical protein
MLFADEVGGLDSIGFISGAEDAGDSEGEGAAFFVQGGDEAADLGGGLQVRCRIWGDGRSRTRRPAKTWRWR